MNKTQCKITITADTIVFCGKKQRTTGDSIQETITIFASNNREENDLGMDTTPNVHYCVSDVPRVGMYPLVPGHCRSKDRAQRGGQLWDTASFTMTQPGTALTIAQRLEVYVSAENVEMLLYPCANGFDVLEIRMSASGIWRDACDANGETFHVTPVKPMIKAQLAPVPPSAVASIDDSLPNTPIRK